MKRIDAAALKMEKCDGSKRGGGVGLSFQCHYQFSFGVFMTSENCLLRRCKSVRLYLGNKNFS